MADCRIVSVRTVSLLKVFALILCWLSQFKIMPGETAAKESLNFSEAAQHLVRDNN